MTKELLDLLWVLVATVLVFAMQAGFLCLETGLTRSKNSINVAVKNLSDFSISVFVFWLFGYALMFGCSQGGWFGWCGCMPSLSEDMSLATFWIFQAMFCGTATTIVSGAVAERMKFWVYMVVSVVLSGFIYTTFGHWTWGGLYLDGQQGWLEALGFVDFAGGSVVHGTGAWFSLALLLIIGPRLEKYDEQGRVKDIQGSNLPMAILGTLLIWMGWFGFNGGSTLAFDERVLSVLLNTLLSGVAGIVFVISIGVVIHRLLKIDLLILGALAGLVGITPGAHLVTEGDALFIGAMAGLVAYLGQWLLNCFRIDDAVGAIPVHGFAGAWGLLAVALLGDMGQTMFESRWVWLGVQALGVVSNFLWAFGLGLAIFWPLSRVWSFRVSPEEEQLGLNYSEHLATTETTQLVNEMERHREEQSFEREVTVDPYSEVGSIAEQYNRVIQVVRASNASLLKEKEALEKAKLEQEVLSQRLDEELKRVNRFNEVAIEREHRMVEMKGQMNEMAKDLGRAKPFPEDRSQS